MRCDNVWLLLLNIVNKYNINIGKYRKNRPKSISLWIKKQRDMDKVLEFSRPEDMFKASYPVEEDIEDSFEEMRDDSDEYIENFIS